MNKKTFRSWDVGQGDLFPRDPRDLLPESHPSRAFLDIGSKLDLSEIYKSYRAGVGGAPPFEPRMMLLVLLYGYTQGVYSSRELEKACRERIDFLLLTDYQMPDHRSIAKFRKRHESSLKGIFKQTVRLCDEAGLIKLKHVAIDGSKVKANAARGRSVSYERLADRCDELEDDIDEWFEQATRQDESEDAEYGEDYNGYDFTPEMLETYEELQELEEAKKRLEEDAKAEDEQREKDVKNGKKQRRHERKKQDEQVLNKRKYNLTDPDSSLMKSHGRFEQAYNVQICVDSAYKIIVAENVTGNGADMDELLPVLEEAISNTDRIPRELSADAGYCSESNLEELEKIPNLKAYIATRSDAKRRKSRKFLSGSLVSKMRCKIARAGWRTRYRLRKHVVEPLFGDMKWNKGFKQFSRRGEEAVKSEWSLFCAAMNLEKLSRAPA